MLVAELLEVHIMHIWGSLKKNQTNLMSTVGMGSG